MTDSELLSRARNPRQYEPILSSVERAAYVAAHRIVSQVWCVQLAMTGEGEFCCPSVRRSRLVDHVAAVIVDAVEAGCETFGKVTREVEEWKA